MESGTMRVILFIYSFDGGCAMKWKGILVFAARIAVIVLLAAALNRIFIPKYIDDNQDGRVTAEFYREKTDQDILFFGSSTVYNAISPVWLYENYGYTSYVRANASQTLWQSYYLLKDALYDHQPKLVMVDMSFMKYGEEFVEEASNRKAIDGMRLSKSKYDCIRASMWEGEQPITYLFPVFRFHSRWKELTKEDFLYAIKAPDVTYNGFIMQFDIPDEQVIYDKEPQESYDFPAKAWEYLGRICELCREEKIPLVLMKTPTYVNNWYDEYDDALMQYAEKQGIEYVNFDWYKEEMHNHLRTDYVDSGSHLNLVGAEKFTLFLGDYIAKYMGEFYGGEFSGGKDAESDKIWDAKVVRYERDKAEGMKEYERRLKELPPDERTE